MTVRIVSNTIDEYHSDDGYISKSRLCHILDCPATYKYWLDNPKPQKDHLNVGNAVHTLALEPELFASKFHILPETYVNKKGEEKPFRKDARIQAYKDELELAKGKTIIELSDYADIQSMSKALSNDARSVALLKSAGRIETSIYFEYRGMKLKTRPDLMRDDHLLVDLKTARSVKKRKFNHDAIDFCYDVSAALSYEGYKAATGDYPVGYAFVCVQNNAPFLSESYVAGKDFIEYGKYRLDKAIDALKRCIDTNAWPSYNETIEELTVPEYLVNSMEI